MSWLDLVLVATAIVVLMRSWDTNALRAGLNLFSGLVAAPVAGRLYEWPALGLLLMLPERWAGLVGFAATYVAVFSVASIGLGWAARPLKVAPVHGVLPALLHLLLLGLVVSVLALAVSTYPAVDLREPLEASRITHLALDAFRFMRPLLPGIFRVGAAALGVR